MDIPDLIGVDISKSFYELLNLAAKGFTLEIRQTSPPGKENSSFTECRIINQKVSDNKIEFIISFY